MIEVWCLDWSQEMFGVHMTWLIADNCTLKYLLHVIMLVSDRVRHLIDFRCYILDIPLFALLLYSRLCVEWGRLFVPPTKPSWSILWIASFTWWQNHHLLSKSRMHLILIVQSLLISEMSLSLELLRQVLHERWLLVHVIGVSKSGTKRLNLWREVLGHLLLRVDVGRV